MRYTHAILVRIPKTLKLENEKKAKIDLQLALQQLGSLCDTLRESGVEIIELPPEENCPQQSVLLGDCAIFVNGTALITRPKKPGSRLYEIAVALRSSCWQLVETPASERGKEIFLEGSDVLFTGKEIFVGLRKNGTNIEGAMILGRTFADFAVIPITLPGTLPLRHYVSFISKNILVVGSSKEAKQVLQRIERQATFRYKTLTVEQDAAVNCFNVNEYVIYRQDAPDTKFKILQEPLQLWGINCNELIKLGNPISRFFVLFREMKSFKSIW
ncbi:unnamed protein product [Dracunculus medinensis]|uniref:Dimethylargininase n=1 Tax=Dracunculus medinensis TaxID=318479 RepID=A0A0N4UBZ3_DRAME|nr:unnamed protein product [Dracunculus medinensis]